MRNIFIEELVSAARRGRDVALVVGDLGYKVIEPFADEFPERFFNAGIAEQNMMGLAAGMASEGVHVFVYSIANFPTFRCAEQIRNDVDYHNLPVTVVAVGGGLAYGALGYSHHAVQDFALMRVMPNMLIAAPGDNMEVRACVRYLVDNPRPSYLRLGKGSGRDFHDKPPVLFPGQWVRVLSPAGSSAVLLATGDSLSLGHESVIRSGKDVSICSLPLWGMQEKKMQPALVRDWRYVCTIEDHLQDGGFGSWLKEACSSEKELGQRIFSNYLQSIVCGAVGNQSTLNKLGGLGDIDWFLDLSCS